MVTETELAEFERRLDAAPFDPCPLRPEWERLLHTARRALALDAFLREHGERLITFADWAAMRMCATEGDAEVEQIKAKMAALLSGSEVE